MGWLLIAVDVLLLIGGAAMLLGRNRVRMFLLSDAVLRMTYFGRLSASMVSMRDARSGRARFMNFVIGWFGLTFIALGISNLAGTRGG